MSGTEVDAGALLLRPPIRGRTPHLAADRRSALRGGPHHDLVAGTFALHADLHNHTNLSDGAGHAEDAFTCMREAGLDAAALTDHSTFSDRDGRLDRDALERVRAVLPWAGMPAKTIGDREFARLRALAETHEQPGAFAAVSGFEWTTPHLGHVNVWFSRTWTPVDERAGVAGLHDWLLGPEPGPEVLFGLNHPGREPLRFEGFRYEPRLRDRLVSMEVFNRDEDYLFEGVKSGRASPLLEAMAAGWRPGLLGVSDEHGRRWGFEPGLGRSGLWVREWSRAGVREALWARRFYATREPGLRLDVVASVPGEASGAAARLGGELQIPTGTARVLLSVDVEGDPEHLGDAVQLQVLTAGVTAPTVLSLEAAELGSVTDIDVDLQGEWSAAEVPWLVVRVADPTSHNMQPGPAGHPCNNRALAYASPIRLVSADPR